MSCGPHSALRTGEWQLWHRRTSTTSPRSRGSLAPPASTLCVGAWTPEYGLLVGVTGDTLPVLVWSVGGSWHCRSLCLPHRSEGDFGYLTRYLGQSDGWRDEPLGTEFDPMQWLAGADFELPDKADSIAMVILSDGAWEPLVRRVLETGEQASGLLGTVVASLMNADTIDAETIAERIMWAARQFGLEDNATATVAHVASATDSGEEPGD